MLSRRARSRSAGSSVPRRASAYSFLSAAKRSSEKAGILVFSAFFTAMLYIAGALPEKICCLVALLASPSAANPYFFCMSSGISSRRIASICHCGEPYHTESVPHRTWSAPMPLTSVPTQRGAELGMRHGRVGERRAELGIDVGDAELLRDLRQVADPADAAGLLELRPRLVGQLEGRAQAGVVHHEVHLRPVLGGLADVPGGGVLPDAGVRLLVVGRQQALVDADRGDAGLHRLLVERIHQLLVVEPPRELRRD